MSKYSFVEFCVCPNCRGNLKQDCNTLYCLDCNDKFPVHEGIPVLLPRYEPDEKDLRERYHRNYDRLALNFLATDKFTADNVAYRHQALIDFIGKDKRGMRILDIGSSHGLVLRKMQADFKVALEISWDYLEQIPDSADVVGIQGDAESLPFRPGFFDVIIIADILEHLLKPEQLITILEKICTPETQVYVHIPWEENLEPYLHTEYEFSHLRSFNAYNYSNLWNNFYIKRSKFTYPDLRYPLIFSLEKKLPRLIYNWLVWCYFFVPGVSRREYDIRMKRFKALPKREWWLRLFYKPIFRMFEMRYRPAVSPFWKMLARRAFKVFRFVRSGKMN